MKPTLLYITKTPSVVKYRVRALEVQYNVTVANYDQAVSRASEMTAINCIIVDLAEPSALLDPKCIRDGKAPSLQVYLSVLEAIHHTPLTIFDTSMDYRLDEFGLTRLAGHERFLARSGNMGPEEFAEEIYMFMQRPVSH